MEFQPGDRINVIDFDACWAVGANVPRDQGDILGTVVSKYDNKGYTVNLDYREEPEGVASWWLPTNAIALLEPEPFIKEGDNEEVLVQELKHLVAQQEALAVIDGKYYNLTLNPIGKASEISDQLLRIAAQRIQEVVKDSRIKVQRAEEEAKKVLQLPNISKKQAQEGFIVYKSSWKGIGIFMPMHYAPKFLGRPEDFTKGRDFFILSEENQERLRMELFLNIEFDSNRQCQTVQLRRKDFTEFKQYNGNCKGQLGSPKSPEFDNLLAYRDRAEKTYEGIHLSHREYDAPEEKDNLPTWAELGVGKKVTTQVNAWKGKPIAEEPQGELKIGSLVKVGEKYQHDFLKGAIGKIVKRHMKDKWFGVEFLDIHIELHNLDGFLKENDGFWIEEEHLKLMPKGIRRTHLGAVKEPVGAAPRKPWHVDMLKAKGEEVVEIFDFPDKNNLELLNLDDKALKFPNGIDEPCKICGLGWGGHAHAVCSKRLTKLRNLPKPADEAIAKFGLLSKLDFTHEELGTLCKVCGERLGHHHFGSHKGEVACPEEFAKGRRPK